MLLNKGKRENYNVQVPSSCCGSANRNVEHNLKAIDDIWCYKVDNKNYILKQKSDTAWSFRNMI